MHFVVPLAPGQVVINEFVPTPELQAEQADQVQAGVRWRRDDLFGSDWNYKGSVDWVINDSFRLRGTYGTGFRIPNVPELFGGGQAKLIITGDEILDSGVQVMAQPPGKKNQTIHLLSGGEKALTAIALVFAIFQLNPAPFCLLDEVDAPLDDANTERYAKLVSSMSKGTQFLFISHNKIAMEMAEQLIGVTMQEQGVSRIVAVDMESALSMVDA